MVSAVGLNSNNTSWATVAGFPVSPYSLGPNTMSDLCRTFMEWRFEQLAVCYIPAVGTGANGQVALYHKPNRADPHIDPTGANFFSYVLNQRTGVIGPVWQPVAVKVPTSSNWRSSVPLEAIDINDESDGEVFLATNNNVASGVSPPVGILKVQYVLHFRGLQRNPRQSLVPLPGQIYFNVSLGRNGANVGTNMSVSAIPFGNDQSGNNAPAVTQGNLGNVFKFVLDGVRSSFGAATINNLMAEFVAGSSYPMTLENGSTLYVWCDGTNYFFCKSIQAAMSTQTLFYGLTNASLTYNLVGMMSLVGTTNTLLQRDL